MTKVSWEEFKSKQMNKYSYSSYDSYDGWGEPVSNHYELYKDEIAPLYQVKSGHASWSVEQDDYFGETTTIKIVVKSHGNKKNYFAFKVPYLYQQNEVWDYILAMFNKSASNAGLPSSLIAHVSSAFRKGMNNFNFSYYDDYPKPTYAKDHYSVSDVKGHPDSSDYLTDVHTYFKNKKNESQHQSQIEQLPGLNETVVHPVTKEKISLRDAIISLNDNHKWTRDQVADWIETLDLDLEIKKPKVVPAAQLIKEINATKISAGQIKSKEISLAPLISDNYVKSNWAQPPVSMYSNTTDPATYSKDVKNGSVWLKPSVDGKGYVLYIWQDKWVPVAEHNPLAELKTYNQLVKDDENDDSI